MLKLNMHIFYDLAISLSINQQEPKCENISTKYIQNNDICFIIRNSQKQREMSMSIDNRMDQLWTIHTTEHCMVIVPHNKDNLIYVNVSKEAE